MSNKEILEKAIQKAIDGGWADSDDSEETARTAIEQYDGRRHVYDIIFNHDFAKALWGEDCTDASGTAHAAGDTAYCMPDWIWHLQQMVIADDPIEYLGENL